MTGQVTCEMKGKSYLFDFLDKFIGLRIGKMSKIIVKKLSLHRSWFDLPWMSQKLKDLLRIDQDFFDVNVMDKAELSHSCGR